MKKTRVLFLGIFVTIVNVLGLSSCSAVSSQINSLKGSLVGNSYTADFYDDYGSNFFTVTGEKIDIDGNIVEEMSIDEEGNTITTYTLSSVITITIDGKQIESCGNTVIFAEAGLEQDINFSLSDIESSSSNSITSLTSTAKLINEYKNSFGKSQVVVIQSDLGIPICAYSGEKVYWDIPDDLPKMTKLMIDGKALYIHRAKYEIIDKDLIK